MIAQLPLRLRELQARNNWTVADMAERTGIPKRTLDKYLLRSGASLPGFEALCALSTGLGVSLDWLVFGAGQPGDRTELVADRAAYQETLRFIESLLHYHWSGSVLVEGDRLLGLAPEEWAADLGCRTGERARELLSEGVTMEELLLWREGRKDRLVELMRDRAARVSAHTDSSLK